MLKGFFFKNIAGVPMVLGSKTYIAPPLNFKSLIEVMPLIKTLEGVAPGTIPNKEQLKVIGVIIHKALRRNYPFLRLSTVMNGLEIATMNTNFAAIINGSTAGAQSSGEAVAGGQ
jgi:hypothetical protein